ncbi:MAG: YlbL family protein, partial [Acidimicrobiia bacterium]
MSAEPPATAIEPPPPAEPTTEDVAAMRRTRRRRFILGSLVLGIGGILLAGFFIHLPYILISPGEATPLDGSVVMIEGAPTYEHHGEFLFLTVRVSSSQPNVYRVIEGWLDDDVTVRKQEDVLGGLSFDENEVINTLQMQESQDFAKKVALETLGYDVQVVRSGAIVVVVADGGPADGKLHVGDVITAVDGQQIRRSEQIRPIVRAKAPGEGLLFTVERGDETRDIDVTAGRNPEDGSTYVGISTQTRERYRYPVEVQIDTRDVGGPSAGLAFTLAIIDDLTPGDLTGGEDVAVTGAIRPSGNVKEVGGVEQKAAVARDRGAVLMIVPESEVDTAEQTAGDMSVVGVE